MAIETHTHPGPWWDEDTATVLTVVQLLRDQADEIERATKGR